jgi:hypothetical protein
VIRARREGEDTAVEGTEKERGTIKRKWTERITRVSF